MIRFLFKFVLCVLLAVAAGFAYLAVQSGDPVYTFYEWMSPARFHQYDRLIRSVAMEHHLDPMLVKAVVWRESRFDPKKHGGAGERGLMQVSEKAANEWARENKIADFRVEQLFDPKTNLEAGAGRSDGAVGMASPRYRREPSSKISISPEQGNMSNQSSRATNSTSDAVACDEHARAHRQSHWLFRFSLCAMRLSN